MKAQGKKNYTVPENSFKGKNLGFKCFYFFLKKANISFW